MKDKKNLGKIIAAIVAIVVAVVVIVLITTLLSDGNAKKDNESTTPDVTTIEENTTIEDVTIENTTVDEGEYATVADDSNDSAEDSDEDVWDDIQIVEDGGEAPTDEKGNVVEEAYPGEKDGWSPIVSPDDLN